MALAAIAMTPKWISDAISANEAAASAPFTVTGPRSLRAGWPMFHLLIVVLLFAILCGVAPKIAGGLVAIVCMAVCIALLAFSLLTFAGLYGWPMGGELFVALVAASVFVAEWRKRNMGHANAQRPQCWSDLVRGALMWVGIRIRWRLTRACDGERARRPLSEAGNASFEKGATHAKRRPNFA
jgi:hypothetical protein